MKKNKTIHSAVDQKENQDKANTVFLKLLAKQKSKRRDWSDVRAETLPIENEMKPRGRTDND
jgi:hypothetical protein